ncbi:uncharacterized protein [Parasteatoda tepidariorum]|uniref:uncharacterized protein n=1 Tax=Parasteatoda tepidariorum TaxID=114398 RepID=UPI00077FA11F|nr:uncharacterized protein LOC107457345 [Parasteatoda tepidariorum]
MNTYRLFGLFLFLVGYAYAICAAGEYLVTMEKKEFLEIVECVSKSKDPLLCSKFAACERLMSPRVLFSLDECKREVVPEGIKRCTPYSILFEKPETPEKIFDCVVEKVEKLTFPEKKIMLNFEECAKLLFEETCKKKS